MDFYPGAEAKGPLGSVIMILSCYIYPSTSFSHIVPLLPPSAPPPLPTLFLPLSTPIISPLSPPSMCYPRSLSMICLQSKIQYWKSHYVIAPPSAPYLPKYSIMVLYTSQPLYFMCIIVLPSEFVLVALQSIVYIYF